MRTQQEILERIEIVKQKGVVLNFEYEDLIYCLDFEHAQQYVGKDLDEHKDVWKAEPHARESILKVMFDYMPFAWQKANNSKGISAHRTMSHYNAWIWLAGDDLGDLTEYQFYGKDNLVRICKHYGWDYSKWDDGVRSND